MENILIVTGGSRGIGRGIIDAYLSDGFSVFSISRTINVELSEKGVTQINLDLTSTDQIEVSLLQIFSLFNKEKLTKITLINNAGTLGKIGPLEKLDAKTITQTIQLNTIVPLILSSVFINYFKDWKASKSIINITSGAALKPYFGWSIYCSSKAAINMMTQNIAVEQLGVEHPVKALGIAPGVVDTDMQTEIRRSDKSDFKDIERFIALKNEGGLSNAAIVGQRIFEMDHDHKLQSGAILRVEDN